MTAGRRAAVAAVAVVATIALAAQVAAVALFGPLAHAPSIPRSFAATWPFAAAHASGLDRLDGIRVQLARAALVRNDAVRAAALLQGLPPTPTVEDLRGLTALQRGDSATAIAAFAFAGDVVRARPLLADVGARDPGAAYALASAFVTVAGRTGAPPPVLADASWRAGQFAALEAALHPDVRPRYLRLALVAYRRAVALDPTQEAYLLAEGLGSLAVDDTAAARDAYQRAAMAVPESIDASIGLGATAARAGDCVSARRWYLRARTLAGRAHRALDVAPVGYDRPTSDAIFRCGVILPR